MDRTLLFRTGFASVYQRLCVEAGLDSQHATQVWAANHGLSVAQQLVKTGLSESSAQEWAEKIHQEAIKLPTHALPGASEMLEELKEAGWLVFITSGSSQAMVDQALTHTSLKQFVDLAQGSDPDHEKGFKHMQRILSHSNLDDFTTAVFLGDAPRDMQIARAHNCPVRVGVPFPKPASPTQEDLLRSGATHVFDNLYLVARELRQLPL